MFISHGTQPRFNMSVPWEGVGVLLVALIGGLGKSAANGKLREAINSAREKRSTASDAHERIPEVVQRLEDIDGKQDEVLHRVEGVDERVEDIGRTVALLHADDEHVDEEELRQRVGVEDTDADLFERGDS